MASKYLHKNTPRSDHKNSHDREHMLWSRRSFMQTMGLVGSVGFGLGGFGISALAAAPFATDSARSNDRILVLIRLKGGNDGLNMIVPLYDYGTYLANRPSIAIKQSDLIGLDNSGLFAMPKTMGKLKPMWDSGAMKIMNSVGYENPNLSHFTSSDIWNAANQNIEQDINKSGWLGRYLLDQNPDYLNNLPSVPGAIKVSSGGSITFQNEDQIDLAINFNTPDKLIEVAEKGFIFDTVNLPGDCYYGEQIGYLRSILNLTYKYAPNISNAYTTSANAVSYSNNELSRQLAIVARLIKGNLGTKLYMVTLDGFDTHENQNTQHPRLLNDVANAISEFYADLQAGNKQDDVLAMTFSEFGRRIKENGGGTDHGTAAPVLFFGPALQGNAIMGKNPDLDDVDPSGNLFFDTDFRSIYATILESWLCLDAMSVDQILGKSYDRITGLGFDCLGVNTVDHNLTIHIKHQARLHDNGSCTIYYELSRPGNIEVAVYTIMGQKVATLVQTYQSEGRHEAIFTHQHIGLSANMYVYSIKSGKTMVSGKFVAI